jgi:3-dehydroquinate synthase II
MVMDKLIWVRADLGGTYEERKNIVTAALEAGLTDIMVREDDDPLRRLGRFNALIVRGDEVLSDGSPVARIVTVAGPDDLEKAYAMKGAERLIISSHDWKVIPLENLIAAFQGSGTALMAEANGTEEARLFLETMEVGADGIVITAPPEQLAAIASLRLAPSGTELTPLPVTRIVPLTIGDRVCVDTCSIMYPGEGLLVGSQSSCLFLVSSESVCSEYVACRPFRVNAGAVHAYVLTASGRTKYLSEMKGGDELLAITPEGRSRTVVVGRAKIERRPLLLVEVDGGERRFSTIVQNAETIRLVTPDGPVSVSDLVPGQEVMVRLEEGGRHFGHSIEETITEI